jgi:hypothetical protein
MTPAEAIARGRVIARVSIIRAARQVAFTLREPRASAQLTAMSVSDSMRSLVSAIEESIRGFADRLDDDTDAACVDCGAPGGTHMSNPCEGSSGRLGFVDRVAWVRRRDGRGAS